MSVTAVLPKYQVVIITMRNKDVWVMEQLIITAADVQWSTNTKTGISATIVSDTEKANVAAIPSVQTLSVKMVLQSAADMEILHIVTNKRVCGVFPHISFT